MQGYDSYHLDTDLQLGGTDQTFNMQMGRVLQKDLRQKESFVIASEFLLGTDGRKMSKSWGNAIWLDDEPEDMYGKVMSVNDDLIVPYFKLATEVPLDEVSAINEQLKRDKLQPLEAKKRLALQIVSELHDPEAAKKAAVEFSQIFQKGQLPSNLPQVDLGDQPLSLSTALVEAKLADSNAEAKRLIRSGSVSLDGKKISEINHQLTPTPGLVIKVGKRRFAQIKS
jgi:tyrosyl-tRNA synthetase